MTLYLNTTAYNLAQPGVLALAALVMAQHKQSVTRLQSLGAQLANLRQGAHAPSGAGLLPARQAAPALGMV